MRRVLPIVVAAATALCADIRPRAGVADYPARQTIAAGEFGAAVIPASEVKKMFAADLNAAGYIVIEVGVFPARDVDISPLDFTLLTDPNSIAERTADTGAIVAAAVKDSGSSPRTGNNDVYVTAGTSIEHASYPDPVTGKRTSATVIGEGVGIGVGPPGSQSPFPPRQSGPTRYQLSQQLQAKLLPDGSTATPVAGYLYFPKPSKKVRNQTLVLQWQTSIGRVDIKLPNPPK